MDDLASRLRAATEDDVEEALAGANVAIEAVAPDVLLEFYNRMLDRFLPAED